MNEDKLKALFTLWQKRLGLGEWDITINVMEFEPASNVMRCSQATNYNVAVIKVQPWVLTANPPEDYLGGEVKITTQSIEKGVVHELLHCSLKRLLYWEDMLDGQLHRDATTILEKAYDQALEASVDHLAVSLVKSFGQPQKGAKK
jgi:hypothetical protein